MEPHALEGIWVPIAAYISGKVLPVRELRVARLVLQTGQYEIVDESNRVLDRGDYRADETTLPCEMDIIGLEGPYAGRTMRAIYELDGDMLTVCYDLDGKERPRTMQHDEEQLLLMITYARGARQLS